MRVNQIITYTRRRAGLVIVLFLGLISVAIIPGFAARQRSGFQQVAKDVPNMPVRQETEKVSLSVQDPRPVAKALEELEARYGWVITYEDPLYLHSSETTDATALVRNDLGKYRNGAAPRVLIPAGGSLSITYDVMSDTKLPLDREAVIQKVLNAHQPMGSVGRFRLEQEKDGQMLHAIPTVTKNSSGVLLPQTAVLDTFISLSEGDRTSLQTLEAICDAVSQVTQTKVVVGTVPLALFMRQRDREGVLNQKARDVLVQTLERTRGSENLSWQLLYDPGMKMYVLNIHTVSAPKEEIKE